MPTKHVKVETWEKVERKALNLLKESEKYFTIQEIFDAIILEGIKNLTLEKLELRSKKET